MAPVTHIEPARSAKRRARSQPTRSVPGSALATVAVSLAILLFATPTLAIQTSPQEVDDGTMTLAALIEPSSLAIGSAAEDRQGQALEDGALKGRVSTSRSPLGAVRVYAYQLADLKLKKVLTDRLGKFAFDELPAGLYKVIAHKPGFVPAVVMVTRTTANSYQYLDLELAPDQIEAGEEETDFWKIRSRIPSDVLRDIQLAEAALLEQPQIPEQPFTAEMRALSGSQDIASIGSGQLTGGLVDLRGQMGDVSVALEGDFRKLNNSLDQRTMASTQALSLSFAHADRSMVRVSSARNSIDSYNSPVQHERYGIDWQQKMGPGESSFSARYIAHSNQLGDPSLEPIGLTSASEAWQVEGEYKTRTSRRSSLRTGVSYLQMQGRDPFASSLSRSGYDNSFDPLFATPTERVDLFGLGEAELHPAFVIQYGLFTTLHNGSVSFSPHAGMVLRVNDHWRAETAARYRFENRNPDLLPQLTTPAYHNERASCGVAEAYCYKLAISREFDNKHDRLTVGAVHREFSETLRLYLSDDFFDNLESLFLVPGDELPEFQFAFSKQLGRNFLTRFESNVAQGGGGIFSSNEGGIYENQVGYMVTSLDTHFKPTSTAVLLAFHRMEQELAPFDQGNREAHAGPAANLDLDRFQIQITQHLNSLLGLGSDWALSLDMQLSRGLTPYAPLHTAENDDELRRRVVGGIAVRF